MKKSFLVLGCAVLMVFAFSLSGSAASFKVGDVDLTLGGSIRCATGYQFADKGDVAAGKEDSQINYFLEIPSTSNVRLKADMGKMSGLIEFGMREPVAAGAATNNTGVYTRHAYATYKIDDDSSLLVGQTWSLFTSDHAPVQRMNDDLVLKGVGNLYVGRPAQVRYTYKVDDDMTLNVGLQDNCTGLKPADYITSEFLPALVGNLVIKASDDVTLTPSMLVQWYQLKGDAAGVDDEDVFAGGLALDGVVKVNDDATIDFEVWVAMNPDVFAGCIDMLSPGAGVPTVDEDAMALGGWVQIALANNKINDKDVTYYAGLGFQNAENAAADDSITTIGIYANCKYPITKGFYMQPELALFDKGELDGADLGSDAWLGVHFQYDF